MSNGENPRGFGNDEGLPESSIDPDISRSPTRDGTDLTQLLALKGAAQLMSKYLREEKKDPSSTNPQ